jgi:ankyrin repeat protein
MTHLVSQSIIKFKELIQSKITETAMVISVEELLVAAPDIIREKYKFGQTALHMACIHSNQPVCELLLRNGSDPNEADSGKLTPLMLAAETGNVDMIETLIRYRADLNMVSDLQESALMIACLRKQWEAVRCLVSHGAHLSFEKTSALMLLCRERAPIDIVLLLVDCGGDINAVDDKGWSALMFACHTGCHDVVELLLQRGASVVSTSKNSAGHQVCPFTIAWKYARDDKFRDIRILHLLLAHQADANVHMNGHTALIDMLLQHSVLLTDVLPLTELLLTFGCEVNAFSQRSYGITPLILAVRRGSLSLIALLLRYGADVNLVTPQHLTPLHVAVTYASEEVVQFLLNNGADLHVKVHGTTPFFRACMLDCHEMAAFLVTQYKEVSSAANLSTYEARELFINACLNSHIEIATLLLKTDRVPVDRSARNVHVPLATTEYLRYNLFREQVDSYNETVSIVFRSYEWYRKKSFILFIVQVIQPHPVSSYCEVVFSTSDLVRHITTYI